MKQYLLMFVTALSVMFATRADELPDLLRATADRLEKVDRLEAQIKAIQDVLGQQDNTTDEDLKNLTDRVSFLEAKPDLRVPRFTYVLETDEDGFADDSWEDIIRKGQAEQARYWKHGEDYWGARFPSPSGPGWLGTSSMPVVTILCEEPEYFFHNTARLPGRFQLKASARWGSTLRFYCDGDKVLVDDIAYGVATQQPIGIYVEPSTEVGDMIVRPFEQGIEDLILVAMGNAMPVYLAMNQDRFWMQGNNIQQHQNRNPSGQIGIKHGPPLRGRDYPFPATQLLDGNVFLADPRILDTQAEGPHNNLLHQSFIFASGNNIIIEGLNVYGWKNAVYLHSDRGAVISSLTVHGGLTADGRRFCPDEEILSYTVSKKTGTASFSGIAGGYPGWYLPKRSLVPRTAGWHKAGEYLF